MQERKAGCLFEGPERPQNTCLKTRFQREKESQFTSWSLSPQTEGETQRALATCTCNVCVCAHLTVLHESLTGVLLEGVN